MRTSRFSILALILPLPFAAAQGGADPQEPIEAVDSEGVSSVDLAQALEWAAYLIEHVGQESEILAAVRVVHDLANKLEDAGQGLLAASAREEIQALQAVGFGGTQGSVDDAQVGIQALVDRALLTFDGEQEYYSIAEDLALYGDAAVSQLVSACLARRSQAQSADAFVMSLVRMDTARSKEALKTLLGSSDPLLRRDVASGLHPDRDRDVLIMALEDAAASVREAALGTLARSSDPALLSRMRESALRAERQAIDWLIKHATREFFVLLGADSTPLEVRRQMILRSDHAEGVSLDGAALQLLLSAVDGELAGVSPERSARVMLEAFQSTSEGRSEELRAQAHAHLLARPKALAIPATPTMLIETATPESLTPVIRALDECARRFKVDNFEAVTNTLVAYLRRLRAQDFESVVAALGSLPDPGLAAKDGTTAPARLWSVLASGMRNFDCLSISAEVMARSLEHLQGQARQRFLDYSTAWLRAHVYHTPDHPSWYESQLDPAFEPVARALAEDGNRTLREYGQAAYGPMGEGCYLTYLHGFEGSGMARRARHTILGRDVEGARRVYEREIDAAISEGAGTVPERLAWAADLPGRHRIELFHKYWPKLEDDDSRTTLLHWLEDVSSPQATKLLAEHYTKIPADEVELRRELIERFGEELYEPAIPLIGEALRDPSRYVHQAAYVAFDKLRQHRAAIEEYEAWRRGKSGDQVTVDQLIELLDSENADVVANAVKALGALRATAAYPRIIQLLERDAVQIHEAVEQVMDRLVETED